MDYRDQLLTREWFEFRKKIIQRDQSRCQNCLNSSYADSCKIGLVAPNSAQKWKDSYFLDAWDFKNNIRTRLRAYNVELFGNHYYVAYYQSFERAFDRLLALRNISSEVIQLTHTTVSFDDIDSFLKQPFKIETEQAVYSNPTRYDTWPYIVDLHVHHKYYQEGRLAWQYPSDALVTLCWSCHENLHSSISVPHLDVFGNPVGSLTPCSRCYGAGWFPEYSHVQSGVCFRCLGRCFEEHMV